MTEKFHPKARENHEKMPQISRIFGGFFSHSRLFGVEILQNINLFIFGERQKDPLLSGNGS
jgi:hypothetical protein